MERKIIQTSDGSHTILIPGMQVTYHSVHGALQESKHVFIEAGLKYVLNRSLHQVKVFEMGFGTGLNAFLTSIEAERSQIKIHYTAIEQFPISIEEAYELNYHEILQNKNLFRKLHESAWNEDTDISDFFTLRKEKGDLASYSKSELFNIIYYDAFSPAAQPELWSQEIFEKLFAMLKLNGILVTYCSKGDVRRAMMAAGFAVQKLPGPRGKREMLRATAPFRLPPTGEATNPQT